MFQFQIGAIGRYCEIHLNQDVKRFNSRLVRLADNSPTEVLPTNIVSIPDWCDWQSVARGSRRLTIKFQFQIGAIGSMRKFTELFTIPVFQFQIGAIGSEPEVEFMTTIFSFNSRLVRLAAVIPAGPWIFNHVSIPDWCDWQLVSFAPHFNEL